MNYKIHHPNFKNKEKVELVFNDIARFAFDREKDRDEAELYQYKDIERIAITNPNLPDCYCLHCCEWLCLYMNRTDPNEIVVRCKSRWCKSKGLRIEIQCRHENNNMYYVYVENGMFIPIQYSSYCYECTWEEIVNLIFAEIEVFDFKEALKRKHIYKTTSNEFLRINIETGHEADRPKYLTHERYRIDSTYISNFQKRLERGY